jgi:hypothetical protein
MRLPGQERVREPFTGGGGVGESKLAKESAEAQRAHAHSATMQKFAAGQRQVFRVKRVVVHARQKSLSI